MLRTKMLYSVSTLRLLLIIIVCLPSCCLCAQEGVSANDMKFTLYFRINSSEIDPSYLSNAATLEAIDKAMNSDGHVLNISIEAFSSPDGREQVNDLLSERRAAAIRDYFDQQYSRKTHYTITAAGLGENWKGLREDILTDNRLPGREQLMRILDDKSLSEQVQKERIKKLENGKVYAYLVRNYLPRLRLAVIDIRKSPVAQTVAIASANEPDTVPQLPVEVPDDSLMVITEVSAFEITEVVADPRTWLSIKTNLAAYVFGVANLGVEIPLGESFSLDVPLYYSPYTISRSYRFRVLATQPELRYWFNSVLKGHFIGLYGTGGWYNVSFNSRTRYQDRDGNTPAWGGGVSYGFALDLNKRWGIEFTAGAGYLRLVYDEFYNIGNGAKFNTGSKSYFGLTKLGITLSYHLMK